jgi:hypothetical protein
MKLSPLPQLRLVKNTRSSRILTVYVKLQIQSASHDSHCKLTTYVSPTNKWILSPNGQAEAKVSKTTGHHNNTGTLPWFYVSSKFCHIKNTPVNYNYHFTMSQPLNKAGAVYLQLKMVHFNLQKYGPFYFNYI